MAQIALVASTSTNAEASQVIGTLNSLISGASGLNATLAPTGAGPMSNLNIASVTSAINLITLTAGASGSPISIAPGGPAAETSVGLVLSAVGTSNVGIGGASTLAGAGLTVAGVTANVDGITITGSSTGGTAVTIAATGSDTNLNLKLTAKGTGRLMIGVSSMLTATGAVAMSTANSLPAGTTSSTPVKFLSFVDPAGTIVYHSPLWA
jgi:hypothetical protein